MDIVIKNVDVLSLPICVFNNKELFDILIKNIKNFIEKYDKYKVLKQAIKNDYINVIKYLKANANSVLIHACYYNKKDIIDYAIKNGANEYNYAAYFATQAGHIDIVKLMIEKGANDLNYIMSYAIMSGHIDIVKLMIEKGVRSFNNKMIDAAEHGHINIVKLMIEKGANDWNRTICRASYEGYIDIVKLMIEHGANNFTSSFIVAKKCGNNDIANILANYADEFIVSLDDETICNIPESDDEY